MRFELSILSWDRSAYPCATGIVVNLSKFKYLSLLLRKKWKKNNNIKILTQFVFFLELCVQMIIFCCQMHDVYANLGGIHSLNCHFFIEIYMFLHSNKSVFNFSIPQHLRNHVLLHLFQLCQKNSEYFSGFCLFSHNIFKKWLQIFSVIQVCDCAATLKITFATSVQVRTISLILFFKNSLHSYWKKS